MHLFAPKLREDGFAETHGANNVGMRPSGPRVKFKRPACGEVATESLFLAVTAAAWETPLYPTCACWFRVISSLPAFENKGHAVKAMNLMDISQNLRNLPPGTLLSGLFISWVAYLIGLAFYRLYLSPISKFPGPKLAALSRWYEFYYEVVKKGQFSFHIQKLHQKYGKICLLPPEKYA